MSKKKDQSVAMKELKDKVHEGTAIVGMDRVMKELKKGNLKKIFLASNCREDVRGDVTYYAGLQSVEIEEVKATNEELGILCKKNFFVSIVGF
jgi:large subunit ribosomal protein L30e